MSESTHNDWDGDLPKRQDPRYNEPRRGYDEKTLPEDARLTPQQLAAKYAASPQRPRSSPLGVEHARVFMESAATDAGYELDELLATIKRGRLSDEDQPRYDVLARMVVQLRDRNVTLAQLGSALGGSHKTASRLETRGRELLALDKQAAIQEDDQLWEDWQKGCRKHDKFRSACPSCEARRERLIESGLVPPGAEKKTGPDDPQPVRRSDSRSPSEIAAFERRA